MSKTRSHITPEKRARIINCRGKLFAAAVAGNEGCTRDAVLKIWSRHARAVGAAPITPLNKTSVLTGQIVRKPVTVKPLAPEPVITHGRQLVELTDRQCSWPLHGRDADGRLRFCGARRCKDATPMTCFYCARHAAIALGGLSSSAAEGYAAAVDELINNPAGAIADDDLLLDDLAEAA